MRLSVSVRVALLLSTIGLAAQAQEDTNADGQAVTAAVELCADGNMMERCPNACVAACRSIDFLREHTAACDAALAAGPGDDAADCAAVPTAPPDTLETCIADRRTLELEPSPLIRRVPQRLEIYNAFFSGRPDCAASTAALESMFDCLDGEAQVVKHQYDALGTLGLGDGPLSADELLAAACDIEEDRLLEIDIGASALRERASTLSNHLGEVATCRRQYEEWLDSQADTFCERGDFPNCEAVVNVFQDGLEDALAGAAGQNEVIAGVVANVTRDLGSMLSLALVWPSCPR